MSTNTVSYAPATFIEMREVIERTPASSQQSGDWSQWEREFETFDPPVSASGNSNSNTGSAAGSSLNRGLMRALLPILAALIAWMSDAMSSDGSGSGGGGSGSGGGIEPASYSGGGNGRSSSGTTSGGTPVSGSNPASIADSMKGQHIDSVVNGQEVQMDHGVSNHEDCANFASACLVKSGEIPASQHTDRVDDLRDELVHKDGWHEVSKSQAKKGDICICNNGNHVEIVEGIDKNGNPILVGSNNVLPDGSQEVCEDHGSGTANNIEILSA